MILTTQDVLIIVVTAASCTVGIALVSVFALWLGRRLSLGFQTIVIVIAAALSIVASTVAISTEMYLSAHDLQVLLWVIGISAMMSIIAAILTGRAVKRRFSLLTTSVSRVGDGDVVAAFSDGGKEFAELSARLEDTSRRLAEARSEVERLDASRRQFFAWISHDLRTPITGISALSEALEAGSVDDPSHYLRQIRAQVTTMNRLVDDLFELSKIQSGTLTLRLESIALLDVVSDSVADVSPLADSRGIRIAHAGVEGHHLQADPRELSRVIVNLLTNSIRYAPTSSEILITAYRRGEHLVVSILDQGSGVDSADLTRIFDIGWRASTSRTRSHGSDGTDGTDGTAGTSGAGLGLAIVQGIVEAHGGHVNAENLIPGFRLNIALPAEAPSM